MQKLLPKLFLLLLIVVCFFYKLEAQLKFSATITPSSIGTNEMAELRLMVENAGRIEQINPPALDNFIIINGPNQESGMESINGKTTTYTGFTYLLKPKSKGQFIIPSCTAKADGKILKSEPIKINVISGSTGNSSRQNPAFNGLIPFEEPVAATSFNDYILKKGENIPDKINRNIFIRVETNKTSCYVGESILVTYKLYTRLKSESNIVKNPAFNGFSVIDLTESNNTNYVIEKFNGREYNVYTLRKAQLYPLQAGSIELEPATLENNIHFIKEEYLNNNEPDDLFGNYFQQNIPAEAMLDQKVTLSSKPVLINVKPLPIANKPANFNGAVGRFNLIASLVNEKISTDDLGKLVINISGEGNLPLITAPEINWPAGIDGFEPKVKADLDKQTLPVSGSKTFEYAFTINNAGVYKLPEIAFSYFDVEESKYKTINTKQLQIEVAKGSGKKAVLDSVNTKKQNADYYFSSWKSGWLIAIAMLLFFGWLFWIKKKRKKESAEIVKPIEQKNTMVATTESELLIENLFADPLATATNALSQKNVSLFYHSLNTELYLFLEKTLQLNAADMNRNNLTAALDTAGISISNSLLITGLLDEIAMQLYSPMANESNMLQHYESAMNIIAVIKKQVISFR